MHHKALLIITLTLIIVCFIFFANQRSLTTKENSITALKSTIVVDVNDYIPVREAVYQQKAVGTIIIPASQQTSDPFENEESQFKGSPGQSHLCYECHSEIVTHFENTAHFKTSRAATPSSITAPLTPPMNRYVDPVLSQMSFSIESSGETITQKLTIQLGNNTYSHQIPVHIVIGSGRRGLSFLYWKGRELYQTPLSFFSTTNEWSKSPGLDYQVGTANFARPIIERCLDCHATFFDHVTGSVNSFDRGNFILGVSCERCHGEGIDHAKQHRKQLELETAHKIKTPNKMSREHSVSVCAQCHAGEGKLLNKGFQFIPGTDIKEYVSLDGELTSDRSGDPHAANQVVRLSQSRCYQESELSCVTCHEIHQTKATKTLSIFNEKCLVCHEESHCLHDSQKNNNGTANCIHCHMPVTSDRDFHSVTSKSSQAPQVRDHLIQIIKNN